MKKDKFELSVNETHTNTKLFTACLAGGSILEKN